MAATPEGSTRDATTVKSHSLTLRCWGTRGSIPSPGAGTAHYGGNTSCLEVEYGTGRRLVFDAGTGLRLLGNSLRDKETPPEGFIFLTHFHWDHIQGFPFFMPLYQKGTSLHIVGPKQEDIGIETLFERQMGPVYFPVPFDAIAAQVSFDHLNEGEWRGGDFKVTSMRVRHPSFTVGYRIEVGNHVIAYVPDNELGGGTYEVDRKGGWNERFLDFIRGADVLFHDAMYTEAEYPEKHGWGHATFERALEIAIEAEVGRLMLFHHSPERPDRELTEIVNKLRESPAAKQNPVAVQAATEGTDLVLEGTP